MWCEIQNTDYTKRLVGQLGESNTKNFIAVSSMPKFQEWFGKGKTTNVGGHTLPFVNPIMQVINQEDERINLLSKYRFKSIQEVVSFLTSIYTPGISRVEGDTLSFTVKQNDTINNMLLDEIDRIYPTLLQRDANNFTLNEEYTFTPRVSRSINEGRAKLVEEAKEIGSKITNLYGSAFKANPDEIEGVLFEIAQQLHSSATERANMINTVGDRISEIAEILFPNTKVGDKWSGNSYSFVEPNEIEFDPSIITLLDKLSLKFSLKYRLVVADNALSGWFDWEDGTVFINVRNAGHDTALHEFLHPFITILRNENPSLYGSLVREVQSTRGGVDLVQRVKNRYGDLSQELQLEEAVVTYLGHLATKKLETKSNLLERFIKWVRNVGKKAGLINFEKLSMNTTLGEIADMVIDDLSTADLKAAIKYSEVLKSDQRTGRDTELTYEKVFANIQEKVDVLQRTIKNRKQGDEFRDDIAILKSVLDSKDEIKSIESFVTNAVTYLAAAKTRFESLRNSVKDPSTMTQKEVSHNLYQLSEIQQLLDVYTSLSDVKLLLMKQGQKNGDAKIIEISDSIDQLEEMIHDFPQFALTYITEWLYPHIENVNKNLEKEGKTKDIITKDQFRAQLSMAAKDINTISYWLGSVINSNDPVSAAIALALKDVVYDNHLKDRQTQSTLKAEYDKARGSALYTTAKGEEDFNLKFLREIDVWEETDAQDADGKNIWAYKKKRAFHTEFKDDEYEKARREFYDKLGPQPNRATHLDANKAWKKAQAHWYQQNTQTNKDALSIIAKKKATLSTKKFLQWYYSNTKEIDEELYGNVKKSYYYGSRVIEHHPNKGTFRVFAGELVKPAEKYRNKEFQSMMANPYYKALYTAYRDANEKLGNNKLRFGIIPQIAKGDNLSWDGSKTIKENIVSNAKNTTKEAFGSVKEDYESPFTVQRQDGTIVRTIPVYFTGAVPIENLSVNLLETVNRFSQMANNYDSMTDIEHNIIVLKTVLNGDANLGLKGRTVAKTNGKGIPLLNSITKKLVPKSSREDMVNARLNEFIDDIAYGETEIKTNAGGVSLNKVSNKVALWTSLTNMALNFNAGLSNVIIGNFNNMIEAVGYRFWGKVDWAWAQKQYWVEIGELVGEIGGMTKSIIGELAGRYDVPQGEFIDEFGKKLTGGMLNKALTTRSLYFMQHGGEHHIQLTGLLSLMHATKVKKTDGTEINLYEAWKLGNPVDNPDVNWTDQDDKDFRNKLHGIVKSLQGIYNKFDKSVLQRRWLGKLAIMFRKHIFAGGKARWGNRYIDYEVGTVMEGYWRGFWGKMSRDLKDYKWGMIPRMWTKEGYNKEEIAAFNKTTFEFIVMITAMILSLAAFDDDDDDKTWFDDQLALTITRFSSDTAQFIWLPDFLKIMRNPAASINMIEKIGAVFAQLLHPTEVYDRKAGIAQKGDNKLYIKFLKALPLVNQVIRARTPEEQIKFYNLTGR